MDRHRINKSKYEFIIRSPAPIVESHPFAHRPASRPPSEKTDRTKLKALSACGAPRTAKRASLKFLVLTGINVMSDINENQHHSRPSRFTLLIAVGAFFGIGVILYWAEISDFAHISQIKHALGL